MWIALVVVAAVAAVVLFVSSGLEDQPPLSNGDFETGGLSGWSTESWGRTGDWLVYEDGKNPPNPSLSDVDSPFDVPDPPQGQYAAVTDMEYSGVRFLYRDIEVTGPWTLHAIVFYEHGIETIYDPLCFGNFNGDAWFANVRTQQFRIDLVDPQAPIYSLEADDILATVFRTQSGDPPSLEPTPVTFDLSPWEGQTVRLRATQVDNADAFRAGIDDVRLEWAD
ncbi:MAG: hypothetical protein HKN01_02080 [Acidimicrobiia bacterium]|nr:hypothetical protein [Acidimicrobiia bacterium]